MSCVCILTPVVIAAWPAFSAAVAAAAASLGYTIVEEGLQQRQDGKVSQTNERAVQLEIEQSEIVTNQLGRDQCIKVTRGGVTVIFSRDARGKASICVTGPGHSDEELRALGEELSQARGAKICLPAAAGRMPRAAVQHRRGRSGREQRHPAESPALGWVSG